MTFHRTHLFVIYLDVDKSDCSWFNVLYSTYTMMCSNSPEFKNCFLREHLIRSFSSSHPLLKKVLQQ